MMTRLLRMLHARCGICAGPSGYRSWKVRHPIMGVTVTTCGSHYCRHRSEIELADLFVLRGNR